MPDFTVACHTCRHIVDATFRFCPYCGKELKSAPASTSLLMQAGIYLLSVLLPPLGLWPGIKYARADNRKAKIIGAIAIMLTVISTAITLWYFYGLMNQFISLSGLSVY